MPRKKRKYICKTCGEEFESNSKEPKYCSIECRTKGRGLNVWSNTKTKCIVCRKEFDNKISESGKLKTHYCSKSCQSKYINQKYGNGMNDGVKEKISKKLSGVSLRDRGYTEEAIHAFVKAGQKASSDFIRGKKLERIVGDERAIELKQLFSKQRVGDKNSQSLKSISERFNCSIEDARKLTTCFGRTGEKHPMYGVKLTQEERNRRIPKNITPHKPQAVISGIFNNIYWQGSWELDFLIFCHEHNINVKRFDLEPVEYFFEEKIRRTWPDFIVDNTYIIEVKGYMNDKSKARIEACEKKFGNEFIVINEVNKRKETSSLEWINKQKEKCGDILEIVNIPKNIKQEIVNV